MNNNRGYSTSFPSISEHDEDRYYYSIVLPQVWEYNQKLESPLNIYYIEPVIGSAMPKKHFMFTSEIINKYNYKDNKDAYVEKILNNIKNDIYFLYMINEKDKKIGYFFYRELLKDNYELREFLLKSSKLYGGSNNNIFDLEVLGKAAILNILMKAKNWSFLNKDNINSINNLCKIKNINKEKELEIIKSLLESDEKRLGNNIHYLTNIEGALERLYKNNEIDYLFSDFESFKNKKDINENDFSTLFDKNKKTTTTILTIENINLEKIKEMFNIRGWNTFEYSNLLSNYVLSLKTYDINLKSQFSTHNAITFVLEFTDNVEYSEKDFKKDLFDLLLYCKENYKLKYSSDIISSLVLSNKLNKKLSKKEDIKNTFSKI